MPPRTVTDKRVLVTGAASGIGRATALAAAMRGAHLFLTDVNEEGLNSAVEEIRAAGGGVEYARALDISDHAAVATMAISLVRRSGSRSGRRATGRAAASRR